MQRLLGFRNVPQAQYCYSNLILLYLKLWRQARQTPVGIRELPATVVPIHLALYEACWRQIDNANLQTEDIFGDAKVSSTEFSDEIAIEQQTACGMLLVPQLAVTYCGSVRLRIT